MKWAVIAATKGGLKQAIKISNKMNVDIYSFKKAVGEESNVQIINGTLKSFLQEIFDQYDTFLFIMATGIVVRVLGDVMRDKTQDPAVLVMDEGGQYVISLLSGHLGGANEKANKLAQLIDAQPVITTSSDVKGVWSIDMLAKELDCLIDDMENAKEITALIVNDYSVGMMIDEGLKSNLNDLKISGIIRLNHERDEHIEGLIYVSNRVSDFNLPMVQLIPKSIVLGVGCRKNYSSNQFIEQLKGFLKENRVHEKSIRKIATIPLKSSERAILDAVKILDTELEIVSIKDIEAVENNFNSSHFVKKILGIGSVAEPCGYLASNKGRCLVSKTIINGMTVSAWEEK